jgi:riboflavin synthase
MFTGIIQALGSLRGSESRGGDLRLRIGTGAMATGDLQLGESIAVSGVCLTVVTFDADSFAADVSNETLALTTLGGLKHGVALNLERALLPTTRLGGHLVSGHVDGMGQVESTWPDGRSQRWRFTAPRKLLRYIADKGSICVDGVSLTVNLADDQGFEVNLVPHTIEHTAFGSTPVGAVVNLEVDLVARYLERLASGPQA